MEGKKISFGFTKTKKVEKTVIEEKKEYVDCLEEKSIKVIGGETVKENTPLVIPMKPNTLITVDRLKQIAEEVESALDEPEIKNVSENNAELIPQTETLDQMVVRELLQDAQKEVKVETSILTVPVPAKPVMDGEKESTLEDYESVPIQDFGLAMLRGMGWTPSKEQSKYKQPQLRPKGLGLGADKVIADKQKTKSKNNKEEELTIVKNSFVKISTGKYSGCYGKVVSLDEDNGRVVVDIPIKKETVSLSEFMMQPVTKSEYDRESKVLNAGSYEEYKTQEIISHKSSTHDSPKIKDREATSSQKSNHYYRNNDERREERKKDKASKDNEGTNGRSRNVKRDSSDERSGSRKKKKDKKRYSSNESLSSDSETDKGKKQLESRSNKERSNRKKKKDKKRYSSSESLTSDSETDKRNKRKESRRRNSISASDSSDSKMNIKKNITLDGKRDIDKKRKGKKKKRDRDRSPNYKKHRK